MKRDVYCKQRALIQHGLTLHMLNEYTTVLPHKAFPEQKKKLCPHNFGHNFG